MKMDIVVKQTITIITRMPFNQNYYPESETIEDALEYERSQPLEDKITSFVENLEFTELKDIEYSEEITVETEE